MPTFFRLFLLVALAGCSAAGPDEPTLAPEGLSLGVAFPPSASADERAFTTSRLDALCAPHVRFGQRWVLREPERDRWVWGPLDDRLSGFAAAGVQVFLTLELKGMPGWLAALSPEEREAEFRQYVRALLERAGSRLAAVQFGNEWNWEVDRYLGGDTDAFVRLAAVLSQEVGRLPEAERPDVVLGSLSIDGLRALAFAQGRIDNVVFDGQPLYSDDQLAEARAASAELQARYRAVFGGVEADAVDLHLYDDVWNWPLYREAVEQSLREVGKRPEDVAFVVSEFGGPHPTLEPGGEAFRAERVRQYVSALGEMDIDRAYYFKLVEEPGADIAHPNSFLVAADGESTEAFDAFANVSCGS